MAHQLAHPFPDSVPQAALPVVHVAVTPTGHLSVQSNIPGPGAWPQVVRLLLAATQQAHEAGVQEAEQAGQGSRIVVPQGVVVG